MIRRLFVLAALLFGLCLMCSPTWAQSNPPQPPIFTYVAEWGAPRAQWADMEKVNAGNKTLLDSSSPTERSWAMARTRTAFTPKVASPTAVGSKQAHSRTYSTRSIKSTPRPPG